MMPPGRRLQVMLWVCFVASLGLFMWYVWLKYTSTCGWEVIYVAGVECK